jgi:hypothetical protein
MIPTLSPVTFEELRHLITWPAELIYGDRDPIANAAPDREWHKLESQYRTMSSDTPLNTDPTWRMPKPFDPPAADIRGTRDLLEWTNEAALHPQPGDPATLPDAPISTIARPNAAAYVRTALQSFRPNPHSKPEFTTDYTDYSEQDGVGVLDGAAWVITIASQTFFNADLFSRSTIGLLTPNGAAQTLRGHAAREHSPDFIQRTFQDIHGQYEGLHLGQLRSEMLREISRWQDIGRSAVIGPDDEIDDAISLVNAETAKLIISKILEKLQQLNGFVVGVESTLS